MTSAPAPTSPPNPELRVGDRVELVGEIRQVGTHDCMVRFAIDSVQGWNVPVQHDVLRGSRLLSMPLAVGDRVKFRANYGIRSLRGSLVAVNGGFGFVDWESSRKMITDARQLLSDLERAP